jgi:hypothetical protein
VFLELVRVRKVGGRVILNAYWVGWSRQIKLVEIMVRQDEQFANASILSVYERTSNHNM